MFSFVLESFFHARNAVICAKPGNISQVQNCGVAPPEVNLKREQSLGPAQGALAGLAVHVYLLVFTFIFKNKNYFTMKISISWLIIAVKQRKSGLLLQQCVGATVVNKGTFQLENVRVLCGAIVLIS